MRTPLVCLALATVLAVSGLPAADGLAAGPGLPRLQPTRRVVEKKKRKPKRPRHARIQPLGGTCLGTSVITATDELGGPIFPRSLVPVTTDSFLFMDVPPALGTPASRFRAIALTEDPPMVTLANRALGRLAFDGGAGVVAFENGNLVRCSIVTPVTCSPIFSFAGRRVDDIAVAGRGAFVVLTGDSVGNTVPHLIVVPDDGSPVVELSIAEASQYLGFIPQAVAVKAGVVFMGGYVRFDTDVMTAAIFTVPIDGGSVQQLPIDLGAADGHRLFSFTLTAADRRMRLPKHMAFLGSDLIIASGALLPDGVVVTGTPEPSHLVRVRFDAAGGVDGVEEIPVAVQDAFVNIADLDTLDGQIFLVDSRFRTRFEIGQIFPPIPGRILRVCPS